MPDGLVASLALVVSAVGLVLVGFSLVIQNRQTRINQLQASRIFQLELFRLAYEQRDLRAAWGDLIDKDEAGWRRYTYLNLIFMYNLMTYQTGEINEDTLYQTMRRRFRTAEAQEYWIQARHLWRLQSQSRKTYRFFVVAERAFRLETTPNVKKPVKPDQQS